MSCDIPLLPEIISCSVAHTDNTALECPTALLVHTIVCPPLFTCSQANQSKMHFCRSTHVISLTSTLNLLQIYHAR